MKIACLIFFSFAFLLTGCKSSILDDPSTVIKYSIPEKAHVKLTIENSYNTLIATLIDSELLPGSYNVNFETKNLLEGIYFYTIEAKGVENSSYYKSTKHLLLIK